MNNKNKSVFFNDDSNDDSNFIVHKDTDNIYLNVFIPNTTNEVIPAEYMVQQSRPILDNMNDYEAGIVRMKIPTVSIPLMIFEDNEYWMSFVIGENDTNLLPPMVVTLLQQYKSNDLLGFPYSHYVYYYSQFLGCVNQILQLLWNQAIADANYQVIIPANLINQRFAPHFEINGTTSFLNFIAPVDPTNNIVYNCPFHSDGIRLVMSNKLFYFFSGFPSKFYSRGMIAGDTRLRYKLQLDGNKFNNIRIVKQWFAQNEYQACQITQDSGSLHLWNTLTRVFITSSILLEKEYVLIRDESSVPKKFEIITDFELPYDSSDKDLRENIYVQPTVVRYMNFKSGGSLDRIDIKIYFQTKDLTVFPLNIPTGFEVTCKLHFRRRLNRNLKQHTKQKQLVNK